MRRLLLALLCLLPAPAAAEVRGVIVGVSAFVDPALAGEALPGAARDAARMKEALGRLGIAPANLTTLTGTAATLGAIRGALDRLAAASVAGDRAVIYLSGHGTQVPARSGDTNEPDGLDEMFLAADAGAWDAARGTLPGALADDEISRRVGELRARGVDVWVVIDSCTGGALLRGGAGRPKRIDPAALRIPAVALRGAVDASGLLDAMPPGGGRLVAFSAAAPGALAWDDGDGGTFTTALAAALAGPRPDSYRMLASRVAAGGGRAQPWAVGDLAAPLLFSGRSPDLLGLARGLAPLDISITLRIGRAGAACRSARAEDRTLADPTGAVPLSPCEHVDLSLAGPTPRRIEAWYVDAAGAYSILAPPLGLLVAPGRWARVGFTFVTRDAAGRPLPQGEETLLLLARDEAGTPIAARTVRFRARG